MLPYGETHEVSYLKDKKNQIRGEESENESIDDLSMLFNTKLFKSPEKYARFDFYGDNIYVELKNKDEYEYNEKTEKFINLQSGKQLHQLWFDECKLKWAIEDHKKNKENRYFIIWKLIDKYFYWEIDFNMDKDERECLYNLIHQGTPTIAVDIKNGRVGFDPTKFPMNIKPLLESSYIV
jgi:hypothetical protein